jgi:hypothetical protein
MTTDKTFDPFQLTQFTGTEHWYRHGLVRSILFTDGAKYVADSAGAYWLLDEIALAQRFVAAVKAEGFQLWRLTVKNDAGTLSCENGNGRAVFTKAIPFTDFPGTGVTLYFCNNTILLPSEY